MLRREGGALVLAVSPDLRLEGPFDVSVGWTRLPGGKGVKMVWCDVAQGPDLLCRFSHEVGALRDTPDGWPQAPVPMDRPAVHGGFTVTDIADLAQLLRS